MKRGDRLEKGTLTVNERVLLHLRETSAYRETLEAPLAVTQQGIAEATGIRVNHVSRAMKGLKREGLVTESTARVRGQVRRRKVYSLSPAGTELATDLRREALNREVLFDDGSGMPKKMTVDQARAELGARSVLALAIRVDDQGVLRPMGNGGEERAPARAVLLDGVKSPREFHDREDELNELRSWLSSDAPEVMILRGRAGMGKTSLTAVLANEASDSMTVLWNDVGEWETPDAFLRAFSSVLARLGRSSLKSALSRSRGGDPVDLLRILRKDLDGVGGLFIFDGCSRCSDDVARYVGAVVGTALSDPSLRVLMETDTGEVPQSQDLAASGRSRVLHLQGLDSESCRKLVGPDMDDAEFEKLYSLTGGHPLSFKLLATEEMDDLVRGKNLTPEEAALVKYLALSKKA